MSQPIQPPQPGQQPQPQQNRWVPSPPPSPPPQGKRKRFGWLTLVITAVVALGVGGAVGGSGDGATTAAPAPAVTVTESPKPAPTKTVTKTKEVTKETAKVPKSCLTALDHADAIRASAAEGFDLSSQTSGIFQRTIELVVEGLENGGVFDTDAIQGQTEKLQRINTKMNKLSNRVGVETDRYNAAKGECRAAAE